jgi:hypothetical protein
MSLRIRKPRKITPRRPRGIGGRFVRITTGRPAIRTIALEILDKETPLVHKVAMTEAGLAAAIIRSEIILQTPISDKALTSLPHFKEIEKSEGIKAPESLNDITRWAIELLQKIRREGLSDPYNTIYNIGVILMAISFIQEEAPVEEDWLLEPEK